MCCRVEAVVRHVVESFSVAVVITAYYSYLTNQDVILLSSILTIK